VSHRTVIFGRVAEAAQDDDVREHFTTNQCTKVDQIVNAGEGACTDEQFRYLQRRLAQAFCQDD
jgi:hypothetical protein